MSDGFYEDLKAVAAFETFSGDAAYVPVPDDWWVGVSDIANSTEAIAAGRYKTVNMVGAAVISAQRNARPDQAFPFVFGGDGAGFAIPGAEAEPARQALQAVQAWARDQFGLTLRAALVPVTVIRAAGHDVRVARYRVAGEVDYAMFAGGGLSWAEGELKAGRIGLEPAEPGVMPDLTGLSCRWSHMPARNGRIVSVLILPEDASRFAALCDDVLRLTDRLDRGGHPVPEAGAGVSWPGKGAGLEVAATGRRWLSVLAETLFIWAVMRFRLRPGGFDAEHYARVTARNADFRKFDDGLKMTLDCDAGTLEALVARLDRAVAEGVARYGIEAQDEAMMTCIVPSAFDDDHLHFIDGAAGGYTQAAARLKRRD